MRALFFKVSDLNTVSYLGDIDPVTIHVANVAPTASVANNGPVDVNYPVTLTVSNQKDVSPVDTLAGFTYSVRLERRPEQQHGSVRDGLRSSNPLIEHTYHKAGTYTVTMRITDKDGGFSDTLTTIVVYAPYYGFSVIASTTGTGLSSLGDSPSINDSGSVAFTAYYNDLSGVFSSDGSIAPSQLIGSAG